MKGTCTNCVFWVGNQGWFIEDEDLPDVMHPAGECRKRAPVRLDNGLEGFFPLTKETDWCGEYEQGR